MGIPEVEELQKHAKNYSFIARVFNSNIKSIISPCVTVVIETTLYINYVLSIQSVLDIITLCMNIYE